MYKILIVEDDRTISERVAVQLNRWGYQARETHAFDSILEDFEAFQPHLVLMDIALPFYDGYHWCREIRKLYTTPIMFISSASDDMSLVMALNMGADDFIAKPFQMEVLVAKVQALIRRTYDFSDAVSTCVVGDVVLIPAEAVVERNGHRLELTKNELRILEVLMREPGHIVSRERMMRHLWDTDSFIDDNTLTVNVTRLRRKLSEIGLGEWIVTKKGLGYFIDADVGGRSEHI